MLYLYHDLYVGYILVVSVLMRLHYITYKRIYNLCNATCKRTQNTVKLTNAHVKTHANTRINVHKRT